ncbi:MAG: tetratricopeptide repeat protein [Halothiobacillus sp.]|nr:tetratricopeptide repeat protein [Halothiobacillus sp.]
MSSITSIYISRDSDAMRVSSLNPRRHLGQIKAISSTNALVTPQSTVSALVSAIAVVITLTTSGCSAITVSAQPTGPVKDATETTNVSILTPAQEQSRLQKIDQNPVFLVMAGELAGQANNLPQAADYYYAAAEKTNELSVIKRASQIALIAKKYEMARNMAKRWIALEPNSIKAAATLTVSEVQLGNTAGADKALENWLTQVNQDNQAVFNELGAYLENNVTKDNAITYIDHLAERYPNNFTAQIVVAKLDLKFNRLQSAVNAANRAVEIAPQSKTARDILIVALSQAGNNTALLKALKSAHAQFPDTDRYLSSLIESTIREGNHIEAGKLIEAALKKPPKDPGQLRNLAVFSLQINRPALAKKALVKLDQLPDQHDLAQLLLGRIAAQSNELQQAIRHFNRVSVNSKHYAQARILMAAAYAQSDDMTGALQSLDIALSRPIDVADKQRLTLAKAGLLQSQGLDQEALDTLNEAVTVWPNAHDLQLQRAMILLKLNRNFEAEEVLRQVIKEDPENATALNALGYTLADENRDLDEAEKMIRKALQSDPENAAYLDSLGWVQYRLGQFKEAEKTLQQAYKLAPDPEVGAHWGTVLWHLDKHEEAKDVWKRALLLHGDHPVLTQTIQKYAPDLMDDDTETQQNQDQP